MCEKPDRDVPKLKCGYPLPCPHHTIVIDTSNDSIVLRVPLTVPYPSKETKRRLLEIGKVVKK